MFRFAQLYILFSIHELLMVTFSCLKFSVHELLMVTCSCLQFAVHELLMVTSFFATLWHLVAQRIALAVQPLCHLKFWLYGPQWRAILIAQKGASVYRLTDTMWMTFSQQAWITHQRESKRKVLWAGLWQSRRCPLTLFWNLFGNFASQYVPLKSLGIANFPKSLFPSLSLPFSTMVASVSLEIVWLYERGYCF
jgi:hypothetical protein